MDTEYYNNLGYMVISNTYKEVARIDRDDWINYCKKKKKPVCADYYRRVFSNDILTVTESLKRELPNSEAHRGRSGRYRNGFK